MEILRGTSSSGNFWLPARICKYWTGMNILDFKGCEVFQDLLDNMFNETDVIFTIL